MKRFVKLFLAGSFMMSIATTSHAASIAWTDWTSHSPTNGFTAQGSMTTATTTVNVTYNNPQGISFIQTSGGGRLLGTSQWNQKPGNLTLHQLFGR